jgi:hypothetical protein
MENSMTIQKNVKSGSMVNQIRVGAIGGLVGSLAMAMYAMAISEFVKHTGFFTPLYHIASAFSSPNAMMISMDHAMHGQEYYFNGGAAIIGAVVHMMTGAMAGIIFALLVSSTSLRKYPTIVTGAMFGLVVLVINGFIGLPIASHLFGGGHPISDMAKIVGWGHFTVEHLIFGVMLGFVYSRFISTAKSS